MDAVGSLPQTIYVQSEAEATALRVQAKGQQKRFDLLTAPAYILMALLILWPFAIIAAGGESGPAPALTGTLICLSAAWVLYQKGASVAWFFLGPFVIFFTGRPTVPPITVGKPPNQIFSS